MFIQAGFRRDYRIIARCRVSTLYGSAVVDGFLMRWPTGDVAWGSRTRIEWPERVVLHTDLAEQDRLRRLAEDLPK